MTETRKGICSLCRLGCELAIVTEDWRIKGVEYLKGSGLNDGRLCPRGNAAALYLDHPSRLTFPRCEGHELRWRDAFDDLARVLKKSDSRSVAITYDANLTNEEYSLVWELAEKLNVENLASSYLEPEYYFTHSIPEVVGASLEDVRNTTIFFLVGDVFNQAPILSRHILETKYAKKSGRIYVVDSYVTHTASFADIFLRVAPGMEPLLLLALSGLVSGKEKEMVTEKSIVSSGVDEEALREVVRSLKGDEKKLVVVAAAFGRTGDPLVSSGSSQYLVTQLPGDSRFLPMAESFSSVGKVEFATVLEKILEGEVKVLINFGELFPHMYPQFHDALRTLSYFASTAVLRIHIDENWGLWLPTTLNLEKSGTVDTAFGTRTVSPIAEPYSGARSVEEIVQDLANALPLALTKTSARPVTRTIDVQLLRSRAERLSARKKNGFMLIGEKPAFLFRSFFEDQPQVKVNPSELKKIGVMRGEPVSVKTPCTKSELKVTVTERVPPGLCVVPVESPELRALFAHSVDEGVISFQPQVVELWKEKA